MENRSRTTLLLGAAVGLATVGGVALASDAAPIQGDDLRAPGSVRIDESTFPDDDAAEQAALDEAATVDRARAESTAVESVGGGTVIESELEEEDGFVIWEVEVRGDDGSVREVSIDAGDARVLGSELEEPDYEEEGDDAEDDLRAPGSVRIDESTFPDDDAAEQAALDEAATVDRARAESTAVESVGGGTVIESELEEEDGFVIWEVEVRGDDGSVREVSIDAGDASVLGSELDS